MFCTEAFSLVVSRLLDPSVLCIIYSKCSAFFCINDKKVYLILIHCNYDHLYAIIKKIFHSFICILVHIHFKCKSNFKKFPSINQAACAYFNKIPGENNPPTLICNNIWPCIIILYFSVSPIIWMFVVTACESCLTSFVFPSVSLY